MSRIPASEPNILCSPQEAAEIRALEQSLLSRFRTTTTKLSLDGTKVTLLHPANADDLINEEDFVRDERLPYWADVWPSSRVMGEWLLGEPGVGKSLIELGCGSGLVAVCAAFAGFEVTATDYYVDSVEFTRVNVFKNTGRSITARHLDWRALPGDIGRFDHVVASDVLYEPPNGDLVAQAIFALMAPGGSATVADPGRIGRDDFITTATGLGLTVKPLQNIPFVDGEIRQTIALIHLRD